MQHAQRAQGLDQQQFAAVEIAEQFIAGDDFRQLQAHLLTVAGQQHPHILHCRTHTAIVQIDEMWPLVGPQDIAWMTVTVQTDVGDISGALIRGVDLP